MSATTASATSAHPLGRRIDPRRAAPVIVAGVLGAVYVIVSPPSLDLAAHLLRAQLFRTEGFGVWSNWWYQGHHLPGYSVLFPPAAAALSPQLAGALAATATAFLFELWAHDHFGRDAWLGAVWFGAATATNLFTGRLAFAFGLLPAVGAAFALSRGRPWVASALAVVTGLCSPVSALFAALAGGAHAISRLLTSQRAGQIDIRSALPGLALAACALAPVAALAIAFPEGGDEPFTLATLAPVLVIAVLALFATRDYTTLRVGIALYALGCVAAYAIPTPVGSNAARLGTLVAGPTAALIFWRRRPLVLALVALPLVYVQWQAPVRDVRTAVGDPSGSRSYYDPLLGFLEHQKGPPFRVEIPFTLFHSEAYRVAPRFPLARGWERQLDIKDNHLFYGGRFTAATYDAWLHATAVRFVAASDAPLDYSAHHEAQLLAHPPRYLKPVFHSRHWRVYEVNQATPIVTGVATLKAMDVNSFTLAAARAGNAFIRVHFTPYWALSGGPGCVEPWGDFTRVTLRRAGRMKLVIRFSIARIHARSPRCS
jgi:hypothetical protein